MKFTEEQLEALANSAFATDKKAAGIYKAGLSQMNDYFGLDPDPRIAKLKILLDATRKLREIEQTRERDEEENAAAGMTYTLHDLNTAAVEVDYALAELEAYE